jgi:hypothetical protein
MKYPVEMGSGAMIYTHIPRLIKIGPDIQKLSGGDTQTHRQDGDSIILIYECRIKN